MTGFTKGNFTNQSGRASSCTRMFGKKKDEQLIASVSGHRSTAIHNYKHISDELCKDLSDAIQGNSVKNDERVVCESVLNPTSIKKQCESDSDGDVFQSETKELRTPLKKKK